DDGHGATDCAQTTLTVDKVAALITITPYRDVYDGQAHGLTGTATGVLGEDFSGLLCRGGRQRNVGHHGVAWSFAGNDDYRCAGGTDTIDITARTLHVSATGFDKIYDGTTAASVTLSDDRVGGDDLTIGYGSADFGDPAVGTHKTVTVHDITVGGR